MDEPMPTKQTVFTRDQLFSMAASYKGLKIRNPGAMRPCTPNFAVVPIENGIINLLGIRGIEWHEHSEGMFTLVDTGQQQLIPGVSPSNYWNQRTDGPVPPQIALYLTLDLETEGNGINLWPQASGNFVSPVAKLPNFRMFKAIVESGMAKDLPAVAREIAESDGHLLVSWTDLGLKGLKSATELFEKFSGGKEVLRQLAYRNEVFLPRVSGNLYFSAGYQREVLTKWHFQLETYRESLHDMLPGR